MCFTLNDFLLALIEHVEIRALKTNPVSIESLIQVSFGVQGPLFEMMFGAMVSFE